MKALVQCPNCRAIAYTSNQEYQCKHCKTTFSTKNHRAQEETLSHSENQIDLWVSLLDMKIKRMKDEEWI